MATNHCHLQPLRWQGAWESGSSCGHTSLSHIRDYDSLNLMGTHILQNLQAHVLYSTPVISLHTHTQTHALYYLTLWAKYKHYFKYLNSKLLSYIPGL